MSDSTVIPRRAFTLMYHDVVQDGDFRSSGLARPGADRYKIDARVFDAHLAAMRALPSPPAGAVTAPDRNICRFLTFDDGGSSAATIVAPKLRALGWVGHFFVTTDRIGTDAFVDADAIRALHAAGHVVGSHSCSHPERFSHCTEAEQTREWRSSIATLSDILGFPVTTASVPGGYYSDRVASTARASGIRVLFHSAPTTRARRVGDCVVFGRFAVTSRTGAAEAAALLAGRPWATLRQSVLWTAKGWAKRLGGKSYLRLRDRLLGDRRD